MSSLCIYSGVTHLAVSWQSFQNRLILMKSTLMMRMKMMKTTDQMVSDKQNRSSLSSKTETFGVCLNIHEYVLFMSIAVLIAYYSWLLQRCCLNRRLSPQLSLEGLKMTETDICHRILLNLCGFFHADMEYAPFLDLCKCPVVSTLFVPSLHFPCGFL